MARDETTAEEVEVVAEALYLHRHSAWVEAGISWEEVKADPPGSIGTVEFTRIYEDVAVVLLAHRSYLDANNVLLVTKQAAGDLRMLPFTEVAWVNGAKDDG